MFKKRLIVGVASVRNLTEGELKAILSHEFGHFYGKDTIIGGFFWRVDHALEQTANVGQKWWDAIPILQLAIIGLIVNIFFIIYRYFFGIVNYYYSRQMEYRADCIASEIAGRSNFHYGLLHYSAFTTYFSQVGYNSILSLLGEGKAFQNIYDAAHISYKKLNEKEIERQLLENEKFDLFATHPPLPERLRKVRADDKPSLTGPATKLFSNFDKLEIEMTEELTSFVHRQVKLQQYYEEAVTREGRCQFCHRQYNKLQDLINHEQNCKEKMATS